MEYDLHDNRTAALASLEGSAVTEDFSFFNYDNTLTDASPALSHLSTPSLACFDTPDTVASHDFTVASSPMLRRDKSFETFGQDFTLFDDSYVSRHGNSFGDMTLFNVSDEDLTSSALFERYELGKSHKLTEGGGNVFLPASALTKSTESVTTAPIIPKTEGSSVPPTLSRSSSNASTFAVPLLPRGRKRKSTTSTDGDYVPTTVSSPQIKRKSSLTKDEEEDDEKAILRAKNTEAAARSRARKKAAMESAENRIQELERENASLRRLLAEKEQLIAVFQH